MAHKVLQLRPGFPTHQIRLLAGRYDYPKGDERPRLIGERSRAAGFYTLADFLEICEWKTHRSRKECRRNLEYDVREATSTALSPLSSEERRIKSLLALHGVSWATASVLLHFAHKDLYPILDYRALWSLGCDSKLQYIRFSFWWEYVEICRSLAWEEAVSLRDLDRALWQFSKENQS